VSSVLTEGLSDGEIRRIKKYLEVQEQLRNPGKQPKAQPQPNGIVNKRTNKVDGLDAAIKKQKAFVNGEKFW
jgi:hypothetical protein